MSLANILSKAAQVVNKASNELETPEGQLLLSNLAATAAVTGICLLGHKKAPDKYQFNDCIVSMAILTTTSLIGTYMVNKSFNNLDKDVKCECKNNSKKENW